MHRWYSSASCVLFVTCLVHTATAQLEEGGDPPSATVALARPAPTFTLPPVDITPQMLDSAASKDGVLRFGEEVRVSIDAASSGRWDPLPNGGRVWRLRVTSPGAFSLSFLFDDFALEDGEELWVYNDARSDRHGSYTALNNKADRQFAIQPVAGDAVTLERYVPRFVAAPGAMHVSHVVHAFRDILVTYAGVATKASGACEVDVNCPQGSPWTDQRDAVALVIVGATLCTGSLINNQPGAAKQYFITAFHCGSMSNAVFRFNYQRPSCGSGTAPTNQTVHGSIEKAAEQSTDVRLVEITESIPPSYGVFYEGYDTSSLPPASTCCIHHPLGDVKKISLDNNPPVKSQVYWEVVKWDLGVTELGSAGGPFFSPQGRFVGQLFGGFADCSSPRRDFFPRFNLVWPFVQPTLDPNQTGQTTVDGRDPNAGCGSALAYGVGCAGTAGFVPQQAMTGCFAASGSGTFSITQGLAGAGALVLLGTAQGSIPMAGGCQLLVTGLFPSTVGPITLTGTGPGTGAASIPFTLPASVLSGASIDLQTFVPDPGVARGFSNTAGLVLTFG